MTGAEKAPTPAFDGAGWVGHVVAGEYRVDRVVRDDGALCIVAATSLSDDAPWTLAIVTRLVTASVDVEAGAQAVQRVRREAVGGRNVLPVGRVHVLPSPAGDRLVLARRGRPGRSLFELSGGLPPEAQRRQALVTAARLVRSLHRAELFHGALSPASFVVTEDGTTWLDWFGLPTVLAAACGSEYAVAKAVPAVYCPPERQAGAAAVVGAWSDIYAFARFADDVAGNPRPAALAELTRRGLAAAITERPVDVGEWIDVLEGRERRASEPLFESMTPPSPWADRLLSLAFWAGGLLMLLVAGGAVGLWFWKPRWLERGERPISSPVAPPESSVHAGGAPLSPLDVPVPLQAPAFAEDAKALVPFVESAPMRGGSHPLLTLVLFGDLTCPYTRAALALVPRLERSYGESIRTVFLMFPLPGRPGAIEVAETASLLQSKLGNEAFWKFARDLATLPETGAWSRDQLLEYTRRLGLPRELLDQAWRRAAGKPTGDLLSNVHLGRRLGVRSTPVLFLNGKRTDGQPSWDALKADADEELTRSRRRLASGTNLEKLYAQRAWANIATREGDRGGRDKSP